MRTVAVVGVGLIGGSFALALRRAGFDGRILGVSSPATTRAALELGVIDEALPLDRALPQADLVYLAQPILRIIDLLSQIDPLLKLDALVTDAGSTKLRICEAGANYIRRGRFLGGHPMAGKETRGVESAEAGLFEGRTYVITPLGARGVTLGEREEEFLSWVKRIGSVPVVLTPEFHDRTVAFTSHLPQLLSTAFASVAADNLPDSEAALAAGPGARDMSRLALSPYDVWHDILVTNTQYIGEALAAYLAKVAEFRDKAANSDLGEEFERARTAAARFRK